VISIFSSSSAQRAVRLLTDQNRPSHSCNFVGHGDDGALPARPSLKPVQPTTELVVLSVYPGEDRTASMNKESVVKIDQKYMLLRIAHRPVCFAGYIFVSQRNSKFVFYPMEGASYQVGNISWYAMMRIWLT
jgi:hypothetical protein